jgi:hypothetical protein
VSPLETVVFVQGLLLIFCLALLARAWSWIGDRIGEYETALLGEHQLEIGDRLPSFVATDLTGARVTEASLVGKRTILSFSSVGCAQCEREMPEFEALASARGEDLNIIGFTTGSRRVAAAWIESLRRRGAAAGSLRVLVEASADGTAIAALNPTRVTPYFLAVGADGRVEARGQVPSVEWDRYRATLDGAVANSIAPEQPPAQRLAPWSM